MWNESSETRQHRVLKDVAGVTINEVQMKVSKIIYDLLEYIKSNSVEGIFRVSGSIKRVKQYLKDLSEYKTWLQNINIHDACAIFKKLLATSLKESFSSRYIKEIKESYLNYVKETDTNFSGASLSSTESFTTASTSIPDKLLMKFIKDFTIILFQNYSKMECYLMLYVLHTLNCLVGVSEITKMTTFNYAIIFSPIIFPTEYEDVDLFQRILQLITLNSNQVIEEFNILNNAREVSEVGSIQSTNSDINNNELMMYATTTNKITRRKSLSARFSIFLDTYHTPTRCNRMSTDFTKSNDNFTNSISHETLISSSKSRDSSTGFAEELTRDRRLSLSRSHNSNQLHHLNTAKNVSLPDFNSSKSKDSLFQREGYGDSTNSCNSSIETSHNSLNLFDYNIINKPVDLIVEDKKVSSDERKKQNRKSILNIFKSSNHSLLMDKKTERPEGNLLHQNTASNKKHYTSSRYSLKRNFSLKFRSKKFL